VVAVKNGGTLGFLAVAIGVSLTACGTSARTAVGVGSVSPESSRTTATPAIAAAAAATATPAPTPAPAPPPAPLLIVSQGSVIAAFDAGGVAQWSFTAASVVGGDDAQSTALAVGGSNLLLARGDKLAVIDRAGVVRGRSAVSGFAWDLHADPTGTRWAWSAIDGSSQTEPFHGAVWVGGLDERPHRVQEWTTDPATVMVVLWSDRGIVTARVPQGCGPYLQERSTAVLDPATGRSTPLFGHDRHVTDVHAGLELGVHASTLMVTGRTTMVVDRPSSDGIVATAAISPDGGHVLGSLVADGGCGSPPRVHTVVGDTMAASWTALDGIYAVGWFDNGHMVVGDTPYGGPLRIVDLAGHGDTAPLTRGTFVGVLR
jgi:hypothetical protein